MLLLAFLLVSHSPQKLFQPNYFLKLVASLSVNSHLSLIFAPVNSPLSSARLTQICTRYSFSNDANLNILHAIAIESRVVLTSR